MRNSTRLMRRFCKTNAFAGKEIASHREAGYHAEIWDGRDDFGKRVASGVYFYRLSAAPNVTKPNGFQFTRKMVLAQ